MITTTTLAYCDNVSATYIFDNSVQHQRPKQIDMDIYFTREKLIAVKHDFYMFPHVIRLLTYSPNDFGYSSLVIFAIVSTFINFQFWLWGCIRLLRAYLYYVHISIFMVKIILNWLVVIVMEYTDISVFRIVIIEND